MPLLHQYMFYFYFYYNASCTPQGSSMLHLQYLYNGSNPLGLAKTTLQVQPEAKNIHLFLHMDINTFCIFTHSN